MLCCFLIAAAASPLGAWLIGPSQLACCGGARVWAMPLALAFGLALTAALGMWAAMALLLPGFDAFQPVCRVGAWLARVI